MVILDLNPMHTRRKRLLFGEVVSGRGPQSDAQAAQTVTVS